MICPCGSTLELDACCGPYLSGEKFAPTAEALMRSRYTAYATGHIDHIQNTTQIKNKDDFDRAATQRWAEESQWKGLKILDVQHGSASDKKGVVEFVATYVKDGETIEHHEVSHFGRNRQGHWVFVEGDAHTHAPGEGHHHHHAKVETVVRSAPKVGRNDPCPCGSGKKYKKCCGQNS